MNLEENGNMVKELIKKFENFENFENSKPIDELALDNTEIQNNIDNETKWLEEIEKDFSSDEDNENIQTEQNELIEDDNCEPSSTNSVNRLVLRSNTEILTRSKAHAVKFYSEYNYPEIEVPHQSRDSTNSLVLSELTADTDILAPIINEFIETEKNFVKNIRFGLENYTKIFEEENFNELPKSLIGKQYVLFRNIDDILEFHENEFLPMLLNEVNDYKTLFEKIAEFVNEHKFYSHLLYNMNKKGASKIYEDNRDFFKEYETEIGDKLGIYNFLMQPVIRLTKYPLLLKEIMKKCFNNFEDKLILQSCCIAEKRLSDFLTIVNESEQVNDIEECDKVNISYQGRFKKVDIFHVYNNNLERGYRGKLYLFEKSLIYTQLMENNCVIYRGCYPFENLGINAKQTQFTVYFDKPGIDECTFRAEKSKIDLWTKLIRDNLRDFFLKNRKRTSTINRESMVIIPD